MNGKLRGLVLMVLIGMAGAVQADGPRYGGRYDDHRGDRRGDHRGWARVLSSVPQFEWVRVPRRHCTLERVRDGRYEQRSEPSIGGALLGGLAGGAIGNQVGSGDARVATTAVGVVLGAVVGNHFGGGHQSAFRHAAPRSRVVERCSTIYERERRVSGYRVTYEYNGRRHTGFMDRDPGRRVRIDELARAGRGRH